MQSRTRLLEQSFLISTRSIAAELDVERSYVNINHKCCFLASKLLYCMIALE